MPSLKKSTNLSAKAKGLTLAERRAQQVKEKVDAAKAVAAAKKAGDRSPATKRKADEISLTDDDIDNLDHVLGSAAEVERVWSIARYVLTTQRSKMTPVVFEAIMFLKFNRDLWDEKTVQLAYDLFTKDKHDEYVKTKLEKAAEEMKNQEDDMQEEVAYEEAAV